MSLLGSPVISRAFSKYCLATPVLLSVKFHGRGSLVGCSPGVAKSRTQLNDFTFTRWRRKWQPTPVFFPGESQGQGSLVGCHLWGRTVGHE